MAFSTRSRALRKTPDTSGIAGDCGKATLLLLIGFRGKGYAAARALSTGALFHQCHSWITRTKRRDPTRLALGIVAELVALQLIGQRERGKEVKTVKP